MGVRAKKTALLKTLIVYRLVRFANVLYCVCAIDSGISKCAKKAQYATGKKKIPGRGFSKSINPNSFLFLVVVKLAVKYQKAAFGLHLIN